MHVRMASLGALLGLALVGCDSDNPAFRNPDASPDAGRQPKDAGKGGAPSVDGQPPPGNDHPDVARPDAEPPGPSHPDAARPDAEPPSPEPDGSQPPPPVSEGGVPDSGDGTPPEPTPTVELIGSNPVNGASNVPRTAWVRLEYAAGKVAPASSITIDCGTATPAFDVDVVGATLVVNPRAALPAGGSCTVSTPSLRSTVQIAFTVAAAGAPAIVPYDRNDATLFDPFPDDYYLVADPTTPTGYRADIRTPVADSGVTAIFNAAIAPTKALDGMSPLAPIIVALPAQIDRASVPRTAKESLDPFATVGLFDIDPASPTRSQRIPFDALVRDEVDASNAASHVLIAFPSVPLRPRGRYAFAVSGRALVSPESPLEASSFFRTVAGKTSSTPDEHRLEPFLDSVLSELSRTSPPLRTDDLALALGVTIRSTDDIPADLLSVRQQLAALPAPAHAVISSTADTVSGSDVAAIVKGTWSPPRWADKDGKFIVRDTAGKPTPGAPADIPFILALPKRASGAAPLIIYQHGQPGSAEVEVPWAARNGLAKAGFAVIGFTDIANREVIPTGDIAALNQDALVTLLVSNALPDYLSLLTHVDQLAFLRMIPTLTTVDELPVGNHDGVPDLDLNAPLGYLGISQGGVHGSGLVAFAPEIHAAALVSGAGRLSATLIHQSSEQLYAGLTEQFFPNLQHRQLYAGLSLLQLGYDHQDPMSFAPYVYHSPLALGPAARASILLTEGLGDTMTAFYAMRAEVAGLGIPQLAPQAEHVPFLPSIAAPVRANMDAATSAAFFQYVPKGYPGIAATPGCVSANETEGHYCAQIASEAIRQRVDFFVSALGGVPTITVAP